MLLTLLLPNLGMGASPVAQEGTLALINASASDWSSTLSDTDWQITVRADDWTMTVTER